MPPDRSRTVNAQGRQKSCSECAKGKRKCDLRQPSCTRCHRQQLACNYPQPHRQPSVASGNGRENTARMECGFPVVSMVPEDGDSTFPLDFDIPSLLPTSTSDVPDFDFGTGVASLETLSTMLHDSPNSEDPMALERVYQRIVRPFSVAHMSPFSKSRVGWSIEQLKLTPQMMVEQNCTPWQHPNLYEEYMPQSLQDACATCALYIARNETNHDFVTRFIRDRVEDLMASPKPQQAEELLARAHALMLYQAMLVFGGDIKLFSQADLLLSHMEDAGKSLHTLSLQHVDPTSSLPLYPIAAARTAWTSYVFRESLRRTVLSVFHFTTTYRLLQGQVVSCLDHLSNGNRITFSAQLWNAKNAFDFAIAWNSSKHFIIKDLDFTDLLRDARPEDIDTFAKMLLTGIKGEDDIKGWLYTRGGTL